MCITMEVHIVHNTMYVWGRDGGRGEVERGRKEKGREKWGREERERKREGEGERGEGGGCMILDGSVRLTDWVIKRCPYVCCQ